jgi:hypothetical protein
MADAAAATHASLESLLEAAPATRACGRSVPPGRFTAFLITPLDRTGVPAWVAVLADPAAGATAEVVQQGIG